MDSRITDGQNNEDFQSHSISTRWFVFCLPMLSAFLSSVACLMAYIIGVNNGTMKSLPFVPFISDAGNFKPSSSVFTLFLILSSFASLGIVLVRFYQVAAAKQKGLVTSNKIALVFGLCFVLGKRVAAKLHQLQVPRGIQKGKIPGKWTVATRIYHFRFSDYLLLRIDHQPPGLWRLLDSTVAKQSQPRWC